MFITVHGRVLTNLRLEGESWRYFGYEKLSYLCSRGTTDSLGFPQPGVTIDQGKMRENVSLYHSWLTLRLAIRNKKNVSGGLKSLTNNVLLQLIQSQIVKF